MPRQTAGAAQGDGRGLPAPNSSHAMVLSSAEPRQPGISLLPCEGAFGVAGVVGFERAVRQLQTLKRKWATSPSCMT